MKPLVCILTYNRPKILQEMLESLLWYRERIVVFDDASTNAEVSSLPSSNVIYKIATKRGGVAINSNRAIKYFQERKGFDVLFLLNDDLLVHRGAFEIYLDAIERTGYHHFCHTDARSSFKPSEEFTKKGVKLVRRITGDGAFMVFTRRCLDVVGGFDPSYGLAGGEHYSMSRRCAAAGFCKDSLDVVGAEKFVTVRQYDNFSFPRSLSVQEMLEAKDIGMKKWVSDMDDPPIIWHPVTTEL